MGGFLGLSPDRYRIRTSFQPTPRSWRETLPALQFTGVQRCTALQSREKGGVLTRKRTTAAVLAVLGVTALTLTAWTSLAGASSSRQSGTITGAGATFPAPLIAKWQGAYKPSKIVYSAIGSGGGIAAITART